MPTTDSSLDGISVKIVHYTVNHTRKQVFRLHDKDMNSHNHNVVFYDCHPALIYISYIL